MVSIPELIRHIVTEMEMDSVLHIKDLHFPEGVKPLQDPELIVAMVREVKEEIIAPVVAEVAVPEPEVIGAKEREEKAAVETTAAPVKGEAKK